MVCRMQKGEISFQTIFSYNIVLISSFKTEHRHLCLPPCQTEEDAQQVSRIIQYLAVSEAVAVIQYPHLSQHPGPAAGHSRGRGGGGRRWPGCSLCPQSLPPASPPWRQGLLELVSLSDNYLLSQSALWGKNGLMLFLKTFSLLRKSSLISSIKDFR